jgi:hypothetical protein
MEAQAALKLVEVQEVQLLADLQIPLVTLVMLF